MIGLTLSFLAMIAVAVLHGLGLHKAALLSVPVCLVFFPLWIAVQIVSGRRADAPRDALDESEVAERDSARSTGLKVAQQLMLLPFGYLIVTSILTPDADMKVAYAGALIALTAALMASCAPAMCSAGAGPTGRADAIGRQVIPTGKGRQRWRPLPWITA